MTLILLEQGQNTPNISGIHPSANWGQGTLGLLLIVLTLASFSAPHSSHKHWLFHQDIPISHRLGAHMNQIGPYPEVQSSQERPQVTLDKLATASLLPSVSRWNGTAGLESLNLHESCPFNQNGCHMVNNYLLGLCNFSKQDRLSAILHQSTDLRNRP